MLCSSAVRWEAQCAQVVIVWLPLFCQRICGLRRNPEQSLAAVLYNRKAQLEEKNKEKTYCITWFQYILGFSKFHTCSSLSSRLFFSDHMTSVSTRFWLLRQCSPTFMETNTRASLAACDSGPPVCHTKQEWSIRGLYGPLVSLPKHVFWSHLSPLPYLLKRD